jgi:hypothetical protein
MNCKCNVNIQDMGGPVSERLYPRCA